MNVSFCPSLSLSLYLFSLQGEKGEAGVAGNDGQSGVPVSLKHFFFSQRKFSFLCIVLCIVSVTEFSSVLSFFITPS